MMMFVMSVMFGVFADGSAEETLEWIAFNIFGLALAVIPYCLARSAANLGTLRRETEVEKKAD